MEKRPPHRSRLAWLRELSDQERVGLILFILIAGSLLIRLVVDWRAAIGALVLVGLTFAATRLFYLGRAQRLRAPTVSGRRRRRRR